MTESSKRLLLVAATTGYQVRSFAEAAARAGLALDLATDRCHVLENPWGDAAFPVRFDEPRASAERLAAQLRGRSYSGIVAVADRPAYLAALVAGHLEIPFHPAAAVARATNKFAAREALRDAGLPVPDFFQAPLSAGPEAAIGRSPWPCVLKPLSLSGSRGVIRADNAEEFRAAFSRIRVILESKEIVQLHDESSGNIQVESFLPGAEFALEGWIADGALEVLALFDKPDPLDGPFFEESIYVTPARVSRPQREAMTAAVEHAARALGLRHGPCHAELRWSGGQAYVLEVAPRPIGGICSRALRFGAGMTLEEWILRRAAGQTPPRGAFDPATGLMMIPIPASGILESVSGEAEAARVPGVTSVEITAKPGHLLEKLPEGSSYLGFLFASGADAGFVERALREAHAKLRFSFRQTLPVVSGS